MCPTWSMDDGYTKPRYVSMGVYIGSSRMGEPLQTHPVCGIAPATSSRLTPDRSLPCLRSGLDATPLLRRRHWDGNLAHDLRLAVRQRHLAVYHVRRRVQEVPGREELAVRLAPLLDLPWNELSTFDLHGRFPDHREYAHLGLRHCRAPERRNDHQPFLEPDGRRQEVRRRRDEPRAIERHIDRLNRRVARHALRSANARAVQRQLNERAEA